MLEKLNFYIKLIRVYQWTKNGFVILPFFFSQEAVDVFYHLASKQSMFVLFKLFISFLAFSFISSSVYIINDIKDKDLDSLDPKKKLRPIASKKVSINEAMILIFIFLILSFFLSFWLNLHSVVYIIIYFSLNLFYSFIGKKIILFDVFIISMGFVIRVLYGSICMEIHASPWLISTTFFIALFLGFYKRFFEISNLPPETMIGGVYQKEFLKSFINISASLSIMNYSLYTILGTHSKANLYLTIPFVVMGIFRYYTLIENPKNEEGNPSDVLLADPFLIFVILLWAFTSFTLIVIHR